MGYRYVIASAVGFCGAFCALWGTTATAEPEASCAVGATLSVAAKGCRYGLAVLHEDWVLLPKSCRHDLQGKPVDRQSVEIRAWATGARVGQASLAPTSGTAAEPPSPGQVLPGTPPLLVLPTGIASIDCRLGSAEFVFEPQGLLLGAARTRDWLALVELLPVAQAPAAAKNGQATKKDAPPAKPTLEWTVIDLEGGAVAGQALIAGASIRAISVHKQAGGVVVGLGLGTGATAVDVEAAVTDATGKQVSKDGQLLVKLLAKATAPPAPAGAAEPVRGCASYAAPAAVLAAVLPVEVRSDRELLAPPAAGRLGPANCLALRAPDARGRGVAWLRGGAGDRQLVALRCSAAPVPAVAY